MYREIAIYRPTKKILIRERASGKSKMMGAFFPGNKIYIDKIVRKWGRICFVRVENQIGGELHYNGRWINIEEDVVVVWAQNRNINKRQQVST